MMCELRRILACEEIMRVGKPVLEWTVGRDDDGAERTYLSPSAKADLRK